LFPSNNHFDLNNQVSTIHFLPFAIHVTGGFRMATQPQLVMQTGPNPGKVFALENIDITIGRDIANDIVINDAEVSRKHARLFVQGDQFFLEDLGSTNGTFVDGQRIAGPHALQSGDSVQMGENVIVTYEASTYDPDATAVMSSREAADTMAPPPPEPESMFEEEPEVPAEPPMAEPVAPAVPPTPEPEPMPAVDLNATMADEPAYSPPAPAMEVERESTYTGPPVIDEPIYEEAVPEKKSNRTPIIAGCGCLVIVFCLVSAWLLWTYGDALIASLGF
jgi:pSer/pThr/pTyr-binding forkhead associated (FHA) protein